MCYLLFLLKLNKMVKRSCFVPGCLSGRKSTINKNREMGIANPSLFAPPTKSALRKWNAIIGRTDKHMQEQDRVCEFHFEKKCIIRHWKRKTADGSIVELKRKHTRLARKAKPTIGVRNAISNSHISERNPRMLVLQVNSVQNNTKQSEVSQSKVSESPLILEPGSEMLVLQSKSVQNNTEQPEVLQSKVPENPLVSELNSIQNNTKQLEISQSKVPENPLVSEPNSGTMALQQNSVQNNSKQPEVSPSNISENHLILQQKTMLLPQQPSVLTQKPVVLVQNQPLMLGPLVIIQKPVVMGPQPPANTPLIFKTINSNNPQLSVSTPLTLSTVNSNNPQLSVSTPLTLSTVNSNNPQLSVSTPLTLSSVNSNDPQLSVSTPLTLSTVNSNDPKLPSNTSLTLNAINSRDLLSPTNTPLTLNTNDASEAGKCGMSVSDSNLVEIKQEPEEESLTPQIITTHNQDANEFHFNDLVTNIQKVRMPSFSWGISYVCEKDERYIMCAKWKNYLPEKRVIINEELNVKIFLRDRENFSAVPYAISHLDVVSELLEKVNGEFFECCGIDDWEMIDCEQYIEIPFSSVGRPKKWCDSCLATKRKAKVASKKRCSESAIAETENSYGTDYLYD